MVIALLAAVEAQGQTAPVTLANMASGKAEDAPIQGDPAVVIYRAAQCGAPGVPNETSPARFVRVATWLDDGPGSRR